MASYIDDYPQAKTQAQLDALPKAKLSDFRLNLQWSYAERIGQKDTTPGVETPEVFTPEDRFELKTRLVREFTMELDLFVFKNDLAAGNAYSPVQTTTTTTTSTTTAP